MSRGDVVALALVFSLAVGGVAYAFLPKVKDEVDVVITGTGWTIDMWNAIQAVLPQLSTEAQAIILGHAAYESGFGKARAAVRGNNVFNITAGSAWSGAKWTDVSGDEDFDANGKSLGRIDQVWRIYPSLEEAVRDYWAFLGPTQNRGRYAVARAALEAGQLGRFVQELYTAHYFSLVPAKYLAGFKATLSKLGPVGALVTT